MDIGHLILIGVLLGVGLFLAQFIIPLVMFIVMLPFMAVSYIADVMGFDKRHPK